MLKYIVSHAKCSSRLRYLICVANYVLVGVGTIREKLLEGCLFFVPVGKTNRFPVELLHKTSKKQAVFSSSSFLWKFNNIFATWSILLLENEKKNHIVQFEPF
jgi:hypothetical protein